MSIFLVKNPPTHKGFNKRLKISLLGNHTMKQKAAMILEAKFWLEHERGIRFAGPSDFYIDLIDEWGHPLTHFANQDLIAAWHMQIKSPYHCAADQHGA